VLDTLEKYYNDGLLNKQTHPTLDLTIWNYTPKVQYERLWDDITIQCRGLVTDSKGNIVARPFKKFFNYEECTLGQIPNETFDVFEKLDGSLGILFNYKGDWIMATRGSFTSEQAIKGFEMLKKYDYDRLPKGYTYLFEIIYKENRIVCEYDYEDLILLSIIETETEEEIKIYHSDEYVGKIRFLNMMTNLGFKIVKKYDGINDYSTLKSIVSNNAEGFVIRFKNGFRMKIKGDEFCRLHRILTNISNRSIWEYLSENKPLDDIIEKVPDEFYKWVKDTVKDFEDKFETILGTVITDYWDIDKVLNEEQLKLGDDLVYDEREYSKRYAEEAFKKTYPHLLFSYRKETLNPINTHKAIWLKLYPDYQKPFKNDD
jgi:RNA ligase